MISCQKAKQFLDTWADSETLGPSGVDEVVSHISSCPGCRETLETLLYLLERDSGRKHGWHEKINCFSIDLREKIMSRIEEIETKERDKDSQDLEFSPV